ncbi:protein O-mannosyl-transferase family [Elusimicrobiota bacterium]
MKINNWVIRPALLEMNLKLYSAHLVLLLFLLIFSVCLFNAYPAIAWGDSSELALASHTLGIAHSPGYPLFVLIGKIWDTLVPFGNSAYRANIFSGFINAISVCIFFAFTQRVLAQEGVLKKWLGLAACFVLPLTGFFWNLSISSEVFALYHLLVVIMIVAVWERASLPFMAFLFGLGLGSQHLIVLSAPALLFYACAMFPSPLRGEGKGGGDKADSSQPSAIGHKPLAARSVLGVGDREKFLKTIGISFCFLLLGFSVYLFLPIRSFAEPVLDWEDPQTMERFFFVLTRGRYGVLSLAQGAPLMMSPSYMLSIGGFFIKVLLSQFTWLGVAGFISAIGLLIKSKLLHQHNDWKWFALLCLVFFGPFLFVIARATPSETLLYIMTRFLGAFAIISMSIVIVALRDCSKPVSIAIVSMLLIGTVFTPKASGKSDFFLWDLVKNHAKSMPDNGLLIADRADELEFGMAWYLAERSTNHSFSSFHHSSFLNPSEALAKEDIIHHFSKGEGDKEYRLNRFRFLDANAGVTKSAYGDDYYRIWGKPRLAIRNEFERKWLEKEPLGIFYATHLPNQVPIHKIPSGLLHWAPREYKAIERMSDGAMEQKRIHQEIPKNPCGVYAARTGIHAQERRRLGNIVTYYFQRAVNTHPVCNRLIALRGYEVYRAFEE